MVSIEWWDMPDISVPGWELPKDTCDQCDKPLDSNGIEYGNGDSGYVCSDCYSQLADSYMLWPDSMEDR